MNLEECRKEIDSIDQELLQLFTQRMDVVKNVARYKKENGLPIFHPEREAAVIQNKLTNAPAEIQSYVKAFFTHLMEYSKCMQLDLVHDAAPITLSKQRLTDETGTIVAYQGNLGAYQHLAAKQLFQNAALTPMATFADVFEAVSQGTADFGVLPFENSTAGTVDDVYDLLNRYELHIIDTCNLRIRHCLMCRESIKPEEITAIYTHQQSILQCRNYLIDKNIPAYPYANNALAAKFVSESDKPYAAICAEECAALYNLNIVDRDIQDNNDNFTRFIVVSKALIVSEDAAETAVCIRIPNQANELNKLLTKFSIYDIDLTKIESRPIGDKDFSVTFYISFRGTIKESHVIHLLHDLQYHYEFFKVLGSYPLY